MSANHSDDYHFRRGDVTMLVENVLFKIHRDILELHSEYFRDLFNTTEGAEIDGQVPTDEHPIVLPESVCSADCFNRICSFLYQRPIGTYPAILVRELQVWESVLQATVSLGMRGLRELILSKFEEDSAGISAFAARLLGLINRYEESPCSLKLKCLSSLVYLRRALSASEVTALGGQATAQVTAIRDRIRMMIVTSPSYWLTIQRHNMCSGGNCHQFIHEGIFNHIKDMDPLNELYQNDSSIFDIAYDSRICPHCNSTRGTLARTMAKQELETEIQRCAIGLELLDADNVAQ